MNSLVHSELPPYLIDAFFPDDYPQTQDYLINQASEDEREDSAYESSGEDARREDEVLRLQEELRQLRLKKQKGSNGYEMKNKSLR